MATENTEERFYLTINNLERLLIKEFEEYLPEVHAELEETKRQYEDMQSKRMVDMDVFQNGINTVLGVIQQDVTFIPAYSLFNSIAYDVMRVTMINFDMDFKASEELNKEQLEHKITAIVGFLHQTEQYVDIIAKLAERDEVSSPEVWRTDATLTLAHMHKAIGDFIEKNLEKPLRGEILQKHGLTDSHVFYRTAMAYYDKLTRSAEEAFEAPESQIVKSYFEMANLMESAGAGSNCMHFYNTAKLIDPDYPGLKEKMAKYES